MTEISICNATIPACQAPTAHLFLHIYYRAPLKSASLLDKHLLVEFLARSFSNPQELLIYMAKPFFPLDFPAFSAIGKTARVSHPNHVAGERRFLASKSYQFTVCEYVWSLKNQAHPPAVNSDIIEAWWLYP